MKRKKGFLTEQLETVSWRSRRDCSLKLKSILVTGVHEKPDWPSIALARCWHGQRMNLRSRTFTYAQNPFALPILALTGVELTPDHATPSGWDSSFRRSRHDRDLGPNFVSDSADLSSRWSIGIALAPKSQASHLFRTVGRLV